MVQGHFVHDGVFGCLAVEIRMDADVEGATEGLLGGLVFVFAEIEVVIYAIMEVLEKFLNICTLIGYGASDTDDFSE